MAKKKYSASVFVNIQNDIYSHIYSLKCENAALKIEIALRKQAKRIEDTYSKLAAELSLNLKIRLAKIMLFHADIAIDVVEKIFQKLTGAVTTYTVRDDHAICVDNEIYIAILRDQIGLLKTALCHTLLHYRSAPISWYHCAAFWGCLVRQPPCHVGEF